MIRAPDSEMTQVAVVRTSVQSERELRASRSACSSGPLKRSQTASLALVRRLAAAWSGSDPTTGDARGTVAPLDTVQRVRAHPEEALLCWSSRQQEQAESRSSVVHTISHPRSRTTPGKLCRSPTIGLGTTLIATPVHAQPVEANFIPGVALPQARQPRSDQTIPSGCAGSSKDAALF
jgi:hypothetical protein